MFKKKGLDGAWVVQRWRRAALAPGHGPLNLGPGGAPGKPSRAQGQWRWWRQLSRLRQHVRVRKYQNDG